jgi:endonuclease-8
MPEGDSLHRAANRLRVLVGEQVEATSPHPRGAATGVAAAVDGRRLESVEAVGKHLLLRFEGGVVVCSHLRMSGRWRVGPRGTVAAGRPWLVLRGGDWEAGQWNGPVLSLDATPLRRLGPDVLSSREGTAQLARRVQAAGGDRPLGSVLLDQRVVAGIGNMWMAEALWHGRVSPWLPASEATTGELERALAWAREQMRAAVTGRRPRRAVYRRAGRPCPACGLPVRARGLGDDNRTAFWCSACQRSPR